MGYTWFETILGFFMFKKMCRLIAFSFDWVKNLPFLLTDFINHCLFQCFFFPLSYLQLSFAGLKNKTKQKQNEKTEAKTCLSSWCPLPPSAAGHTTQAQTSQLLLSSHHSHVSPAVIMIVYQHLISHDAMFFTFYKIWKITEVLCPEVEGQDSQ